MSSSVPPKGYLARYALPLLKRGYQVIPIKGGEKRPAFEKWETTKASPELIDSWIGKYPTGGVGILTKRTPLVDIDVLDAEVSVHMIAFVQDRFGPAPARVGFAPKTGLLFRTETPFVKVQSDFYVDEWDQKHKLEVLGNGQQFVAYAKHPDTGRPYYWLDNNSPIITRASELPILTQENAVEIRDEFVRIAKERGWELKKSATALARISAPVKGRIDRNDVFASDAARVEDLSDDEIAEKLMLVPGNEDHDTWFQIGMALYHQYEGEDRGLKLWHQWSESAQNYDSDALDYRWTTFNVEGKGRAPVTAKLILKLAKAAEQEVAVETFNEVRSRLEQAMSVEEITAICKDVKAIQFGPIQRNDIVSRVQKKVKLLTGATFPVSLAREMTKYENPSIRDAPGWCQGWVHVSHGNNFYNKKSRRSMSIEAFNSAFNRHMLTPTERREGKAYPETRASDFALNVVEIETVQNTIYMPGEDDEFTYNGQPVVNTYSDRNVPAQPDKYTRADREAIATVEAHFTHLFINERDRTILLDAMAFIVQNPGKRINFAFMIQGTEKDGKTILSGLMASVLGPDNVRNVMAGMLEEKYTAWAEGSQAIFVEEIKLHGHNRFDVLNKVKPLITNALVSIRKMQTDVYEAPNTASYFLFTNFPDALPVDENDSRYFIMFTRWQSQDAINAFLKTDPDYYTRLFAAIENHPGALRRWLLSREISADFKPNARAPESTGKTAMIGYNRTEEEECVLDIIANAPSTQLTNHILNVSHLSEAMGDKGTAAPYGRAMNALLIKLGFRRLHRIRDAASGNLQWLWTKQEAKFTDTFGTPNLGEIMKWIEDDL